MTRILIAILGFGLLVPSITTNSVRGDKEMPLRVVFHINSADGETYGRALKNIKNLLAEAPDSDVVVVCHGPGIHLVLKQQPNRDLKPEMLQDRGVRFVACRNTMRELGLKEADLLPGVTTVAAGTLEVIRKQHEGYAYFKP